MVDYARIEPETEVHRTEKALKEIAPSAQLPFGKGLVHVKVQPSLRNTPVAQHITSLLVHLLLRMKGIVRDVWIEGVGEVPMRASVPLEGTTFCEGLRNLADSLNGPLSPYCSRIHDGKPESEPDVVVVVGNGDGDIRLGADAWRALIGDYADEAEWAHACPVGPYMAATIGATEVFKRLLKVNFGWTEGTAVTNLAFSLLDYGVDDRATAGPDIASISANDLAIAGAGAGGTAVLYTLASFPAEDGSIVLVEPVCSRSPISTGTCCPRISKYIRPRASWNLPRRS